METIIISSLRCSQYAQPFHPESPDRVRLSYQYLKKKKYKIIEPLPVTESDILLVHTPQLLQQVKDGTFSDADTPVLEDIYQYACLSAGAAIQAMKLADKNRFPFSLMRPPGHHAGKDFLGGFCYFNNIAIAVQKFLSTKSGNKAAILDIDVHHGNGTEDIFLGKNNMLYVSLHQVPLYPGTGLRPQQNCLNFSIPPGANETSYLVTLDKALTELKKFSPTILGISAGFDTYEGDPLANIKLAKETYHKIGQRIKGLNMPVFAVLEGGYSNDLPLLIEQFILGVCK